VKLLVTLMTGALALISAPAPAFAEPAPDAQVDVVLDISGSMKEPAGTGGTKIEAARRAVHTAVDALPDSTRLGLRTFGGCGRTTQAVPVGPLDRSRVKQAVDATVAAGDTPLALALQQAGRDFQPGERRSVLLVSDGEETCGGDPVAAARTLANNCVDVRVDVIGFRVDAKTREQLARVAAAGCGQYLDAADGAALVARIRRGSLSALRTGAATGTPVTGALDKDSAPVITPGVWRDVLPGDGADRYYAFDLPAGAIPHVSATMPGSAPLGAKFYQGFFLRLDNQDGRTCGYTNPHRYVAEGGANTLASGVTGNHEERGCVGPGRMTLSIDFHIPDDQPRTPTPVELTLVIEPGVRDAGALPEPYVSPEKEPAPPVTVSGQARPVTGSGSFIDAPVLANGVYTDRIRPGEEVYYRVPVTWGQRLVARLRLPEDKEFAARQRAGSGYRQLRLDLHSPASRTDVTLFASDQTMSYDGSSAQETVAFTAPVRYRNRATKDLLNRDEVTATALPGYYFLRLVCTADAADNDFELVVQFDVEAVGTRAGAPTYDNSAGTDPEAALSAPPRSAAGHTGPRPRGLVLAGAGVGAAVLVAGLVVGLLLLRRRRAAS
jgi:Ca-activated chloride channel family protein